MMKADPVRDETRTTHNYFAHGGNELVIGGKLTFLPTATVEGGDNLFGGAGITLAANLPASNAAAVDQDRARGEKALRRLSRHGGHSPKGRRCGVWKSGGIRPRRPASGSAAPLRPPGV